MYVCPYLDRYSHKFHTCHSFKSIGHFNGYYVSMSAFMHVQNIPLPKWWWVLTGVGVGNLKYLQWRLLEQGVGTSQPGMEVTVSEVKRQDKTTSSCCQSWAYIMQKHPQFHLLRIFVLLFFFQDCGELPAHISHFAKGRHSHRRAQDESRTTTTTITTPNQVIPNKQALTCRLLPLK